MKHTKFFYTRPFRYGLDARALASVEAYSNQMSIRRYSKPRDGLPDPQGCLSSAIPSHAIALSNKEVERAMSEEAA